MRWLKGLTVAIALLASLGGFSTATAQQKWEGPTIAHGTSKGGINWRIWGVRAGAGLFTVEFGASMKLPVKFDRTEVSGFAFAIDPRERFPSVVSIRRQNLGPRSETCAAGIATGRAKYLVFTMRSGRAFRRETLHVGDALAERWPDLARLRYFNEYFHNGQLPTRVAAVSASGRELGRYNFPPVGKRR